MTSAPLVGLSGFRSSMLKQRFRAQTNTAFLIRLQYFNAYFLAFLQKVFDFIDALIGDL